MKRNMNLLREIFLAYQEERDIRGYEDREIQYHLKLLEDAGLARLKESDNQYTGYTESVRYEIERLTWQGHNLAVKARNDGRWNHFQMIEEDA